MAYDVTKTDGTRLTILADRTVDVTTPIKLIGKNYAGYGEIMAENLVQMLEHFSSPGSLTTYQPEDNKLVNPIIGQLWYDSVNEVINIYTAGGWSPLGGRDLIGGKKTGIKIGNIIDTYGQPRPAMQFIVNKIVVAIMSSDAGTYTPGGTDAALANAFPEIGQGINLNQSGTADVGEETWGNFKLRGRTVEAEFADMAEIYRADTPLIPGNLVRLGGDKEITKTIKAWDDEVFGVISTAPGFLLNSRMKMQEHAYPVALKGRVPCLVKGPIRAGQRIVPSDISGVGMAADHYDPAAIIGQAISSKDTEEVGLVEAAVGVK
jgi:hypothetical protein